MLTPERYLDDLYEYVDLWAAGYIKAHSPNSEGEVYLRLKVRLVEALLDRFDVINRLRLSIGLGKMNVGDCYDYYINDMPEFDESKKVIELYSYDQKTRELAEKETSFNHNPNAQAYLLVMGAPDIFIENSQVVQDRIDHYNKLLVEGGYDKISPQRTEEILEQLLVVTNW